VATAGTPLGMPAAVLLAIAVLTRAGYEPYWSLLTSVPGVNVTPR